MLLIQSSVPQTRRKGSPREVPLIIFDISHQPPLPCVCVVTVSQHEAHLMV